VHQNDLDFLDSFSFRLNLSSNPMATPSNSKSKNTKPAPAPVVVAKPAAKPVAKAAKPALRREPTPEEIGARAFEIYVSEGRQDGYALEHWLRAEKELRSPN
jgi:hypothetical protein